MRDSIETLGARVFKITQKLFRLAFWALGFGFGVTEKLTDNIVTYELEQVCKADNHTVIFILE